MQPSLLRPCADLLLLAFGILRLALGSRIIWVLRRRRGRRGLGREATLLIDSQKLIGDQVVISRSKERVVS